MITINTKPCVFCRSLDISNKGVLQYLRGEKLHIVQKNSYQYEWKEKNMIVFGHWFGIEELPFWFHSQSREVGSNGITLFTRLETDFYTHDAALQAERVFVEEYTDHRNFMTHVRGTTLTCLFTEIGRNIYVQFD